MNDRLIGRAGFLGIVGVGVAGLFYGRRAEDWLGRVLPDQVGAIVPTNGWRIYTIGSGMPDLRPVSYRLAVGGLVERPQTFTLRDLRALPATRQVSDFHCVTGWTVEDVHWTGVRLSRLLEQVRPAATAHAVRFVSAEPGYHDSLTLDQARLADVVLAYGMDGKPLSRPHGAPVRLVIPEMYGYKSVKWVSRIELLARPRPGYWEQHGYDVDAWVGRSNGYVGFRS
jgi:DMSO/TMAO reductase YedYZ molybdopterin-dependent catalytic subunit